MLIIDLIKDIFTDKMRQKEEINNDHIDNSSRSQSMEETKICHSFITCLFWVQNVTCILNYLLLISLLHKFCMIRSSEQYIRAYIINLRFYFVFFFAVLKDTSGWVATGEIV